LTNAGKATVFSVMQNSRNRSGTHRKNHSTDTRFMLAAGCPFRHYYCVTRRQSGLRQHEFAECMAIARRFDPTIDKLPLRISNLIQYMSDTQRESFLYVLQCQPQSNQWLVEYNRSA
jgi:hypothetical protein